MYATPKSYSRSFPILLSDPQPRFVHRKSRFRSDRQRILQNGVDELLRYRPSNASSLFRMRRGDEFQAGKPVSHLAQDHGPSLLAVSSPEPPQEILPRLVDAFGRGHLYPGTARLRINRRVVRSRLRRSGVGTRPNGRVSWPSFLRRSSVKEYQEGDRVRIAVVV